MVPKIKKNKNPPVLSHEFVIQNHADIVSCTAMLFVVGLMVQAISPLCSPFITLQYNVEDAEAKFPVLYTHGILDICTVFFYSLICIVLHAVIQEYILDRINKKLHLSKIKSNQFIESGQLVLFYILSVVWAADIIIKENLLWLSPLWSDYPQAMTFMTKFFFILQFAYWIHCYPELYFQKAKPDEISDKVKYPTLTLLFMLPAYLLNFNRIAVVLVFFHYLAEGSFHAARLVDFVDKQEKRSQVAYSASNIVFLAAQISTVVLTLLTFVYGFHGGIDRIDAAQGNFNTVLVRLLIIAVVCGLQGYLFFFKGEDIFKPLKDLKIELPSILKFKFGKTKVSNSKGNKKQNLRKRKDHKTGSDNELTEADQYTKKALKGNHGKAK